MCVSRDGELLMARIRPSRGPPSIAPATQRPYRGAVNLDETPPVLTMPVLAVQLRLQRIARRSRLAAPTRSRGSRSVRPRSTDRRS